MWSVEPADRRKAGIARGGCRREFAPSSLDGSVRPPSSRSRTLTTSVPATSPSMCTGRGQPRRGGMGEAHLSTEQSPSGQEARLPPADEHAGRARRPEGPPSQGPSPAVGLITPLRGRGDFDRLRAEGRRWSASGVWCVHRAGSPGDPTRIAFAIGRKVGNAVTRNRLRRRLREILRSHALPVGDYLIGVRPEASQMSFVQLQQHVGSLVSLVRSGAGRS